MLPKRKETYNKFIPLPYPIIKMEVSGKIIVSLPEVSGVSRNGNNWKKKEYVLETTDMYPRKVYFTCFGDNADKIKLNVGDMVTVSIDIDAREYNGRWYTDIRAWKAEPYNPAGVQGAGAPAAPAAAAQAPAVPNPPVQAAADEEFPF